MKIQDSWLTRTPIAHRGLHDKDIPENSLAAFSCAVKKKYPIELDVRLLDDGTVIVFHDNKLSRMTGKDGYIDNLTAEKLADLRLMKTEHGIPTFEKVLETVNGAVPILIEFKTKIKTFALENNVIQMLKGYNGETAVESFDPYSMEYFSIHAPNIMRGQLAHKFIRGYRDVSIVQGLRQSKLKLNYVSKPDFIAYNASDLPCKAVSKCNLPVIAWTVTSQAQAKKLQPYIDNFIFEGFTPAIDE